MADDLPTLRLFTLRRLLADLPPPLVFDLGTPVATIEDAFRDAPNATAVVIAPDGVLQGTLRRSDLVGVAGNTAAEAVMVTECPMLDADHEIDAALLALADGVADRVLVVGARVLLGVLSRDALLAARGARLRAA